MEKDWLGDPTLRRKLFQFPIAFLPVPGDRLFPAGPCLEDIIVLERREEKTWTDQRRERLDRWRKTSNSQANLFEDQFRLDREKP